MNWRELNKQLGNIDIYWLDFILKGYLKENARILDVGCGEGRNLHYCMKEGFDVFGIDKEPLAIQYIKQVAKTLKMNDVDARFQQMSVTNLLFPDKTFDIVLSSAVFHFANSREEFNKMWEESLRVLRPGGYLFVRTMTDHFLQGDKSHIVDNIITFNEGESRFVLDDSMIAGFDKDFPVKWVEPFKYVVIQNVRAMSTIILQKLEA